MHWASPSPSAALLGLSDVIRRVRPVPDLRALLLFTTSQLEPAVDLDAPADLWVRGPLSANAGFLVVFRRREGAPAARAGADSGIWHPLRLGNAAFQARSLGTDRVAFTDVPAWADRVLAGEGSAPTQALRAVNPKASSLSITLAPKLFAPARSGGGAAPPFGPDDDAPEEGRADSAFDTDLATESERIQMDLSLAADEVTVRFTCAPRPGSELAEAVTHRVALSRDLLEAVPSGAPVVMVGDARNFGGGTWSQALGTSFDFLSTGLPLRPTGGHARRPSRLALPEPTEQSAERLRAILTAVKGPFLWSLVGEPGTGASAFVLTAPLDAPPSSETWATWGGPGAAAVAYRIGAVEVHRLEGTGRFLPADAAFVQGRLLMVAGGRPRGVLDGLVSGRLATGRASHPAFSAAFEAEGVDAAILGTLDVAAVLRLSSSERMAPLPPVGNSATTYVVGTDGTVVFIQVRMPIAQIDRLVGVLGDVLPERALPGPPADWLFPQGI